MKIYDTNDKDVILTYYIKSNIEFSFITNEQYPYVLYGHI